MISRQHTIQDTILSGVQQHPCGQVMRSWALLSASLFARTRLTAVTLHMHAHQPASPFPTHSIPPAIQLQHSYLCMHNLAACPAVRQRCNRSNNRQLIKLSILDFF